MRPTHFSSVDWKDSQTLVLDEEGNPFEAPKRSILDASFIAGQIEQIRNGGIRVLLRKASLLLIKALEVMLVIVLALPCLVVIRLVRPLILVRFGSVQSCRIGDYAISTELYLCRRELGHFGVRTVDLFCNWSGAICNRQLHRMRRRKLRISRFARWLTYANDAVPGGKQHIVPINRVMDSFGWLSKTSLHLEFAPDEIVRGTGEAEKMGMGEGTEFICFNCRDPAYLQTAIKGAGDFSYHNFRDSSILNYLSAAEEMTRRGYFAVRMGHTVAEEIEPGNEKIVDYARTHRSDFMDIYLSGTCRFFIAALCGISEVPECFRRPIAWTNIIPYRDIHTWERDSLFILKKLWLKTEKRLLTFREVFCSEIGSYCFSKQYEDAHIEVIENTADEIRDLATEMDDGLRGVCNRTEEDEELQRRFWATWRPRESGQVQMTRIGTEFLRQNRELLEC